MSNKKGWLSSGISRSVAVVMAWSLGGCVAHDEFVQLDTESTDGQEGSSEEKIIEPTGAFDLDEIDAGSLVVNSTPTTSNPDSGVFDHCRQELPGITVRSEDGADGFDSSGLSSSQQFQSSGSGEWDDNANYRRYLELVARAPVHEDIDVSGRQFVVVLDDEGRGVGNCEVRLKDQAGTTATVTTLASGRVPVFPALYGFEGPLQVKARCLSASGTATLPLDIEDDVAVVQLDEARPSAPSTLDLAFVLDVTGSMAAEIEAMKSTIDTVASQIVSAGQADVRLAIVAYRDYGDSPAFEIKDFSDDIDSFRAFVDGLSASGGGDTPEALNEAMDRASRLDWNPDATARMTFVIADAPPHAGEQHSAARAAAVLACGGVKIFTVATTGQDLSGRYIFRQMSQLSYATHLFLLRAGTSTNPECSDHQFRTGELNNIVTERIEGELASVNQDPLEIPGLSEDRDTEVAEVLDECAVAASEASGEDLMPVIK